MNSIWQQFATLPDAALPLCGRPGAASPLTHAGSMPGTGGKFLFGG
jgi:hypothetical protein